MNPSVYIIRKDSWLESIHRLLEIAGLTKKLRFASTIIIKPNLVEALPPPITTPVVLVDALIDYLQITCPQCRLVVGEGTGSVEYDTFHCFETLGYKKMAAARKIELIDFNAAPLVRKNNPHCPRFPEMFLPAILDQAYLLSVPVLKAHSLAGVTLSMKNMMGCVPPSHYRSGNSWGKSAFHRGLDQAIVDLNRYRTPDFTLLDSSVGMAEHHLGGSCCQPPVGLLAAGYDSVAIDSYGASLLGKNYQDIGHIRLAHRCLGSAEPLDIVECGV